MVDFDLINIEQESFTENAELQELKPWSDVFGFPLKLEPTEKEMETQPYKGTTKDKYQFEFKFSGHIWRIERQVTPHKDIHLRQGKIITYPDFIYSRLRFEEMKRPDVKLLQALEELDTIITKGDMNFIEDNQYRGNSYKYDTPFYLSFLKAMVGIYFVDDATIISATKLEGAIAVQRFGVYCPYYKIVEKYRPAILLNLKAFAFQAKMNKLDVCDLYKRVLLELFAYAFQDPTNAVDSDGYFPKPTYFLPTKEADAIQYDRQAAEEFVNSYLSLSH